MSDAAIDIQSVSKTYRGGIQALREVALTVERGEIFGLLGPNGAGKSTLVKILVTVVHPTRVQGTLLGKPVGHKATLARVGYLPENHRFPSYLKGGEVMDYYGALAGVPRARRKQRSAELLEQVGMLDWADTPIAKYSKGMMQRVGLAQALVNEPDIVFLDEPTDGVDPVGRREIRDMLLGLKDKGYTIFVNSHLLSELERVCDRVAILVDGQIKKQGTLDELAHESKRYEIEIEGGAPDWVAAEAGVTAAPAALPGRTLLAIANCEVERVQPLIDRLRGDARILHRVQPAQDSLEDLFIREVQTVGA